MRRNPSSISGDILLARIASTHGVFFYSTCCRNHDMVSCHDIVSRLSLVFSDTSWCFTELSIVHYFLSSNESVFVSICCCRQVCVEGEPSIPSTSSCDSSFTSF